MTIRPAQRVGLAALLVIGLPACMVEMSAKVDGTLNPALRADADTHVALYADDEPTEAVVREALLRSPHVIVDPVDADARARFRASCGVRGCDEELVHGWARDRGDTLTVIARVRVDRAGTRICSSYRFGPDGGSCLEESIEGETATVDIRVETRTARSTGSASTTRRAIPTLHARAQAQGAHAVDEARAAALARLHVDYFQYAVTPQLSVGPDGRLSPDAVADHSVFVVLRDGERQTMVDVSGPATPGQTATPLYCCVETQPGDTLVYRGPQALVELLPTAALARLSVDGDARAAGLFGISLRVRNLRRGLRGGASYEYVVARDVRMSIGTFELGYGFRPSPAWALGLLGGVGGGQATRAVGGDIRANGGHVEGILRATWEPRRWVFLNLDVGFIQSFGYGAWKNDAGPVAANPLHLAGPFVRLAADIR